jgi:cytochrome c
MRTLILSLLAMTTACAAGATTDGAIELGTLGAGEADGFTGVSFVLGARETATATGESDGPFVARFATSDPAAYIYIRITDTRGEAGWSSGASPSVESSRAGEFTVEVANLLETTVEGRLEVTPRGEPVPELDPTPALATYEDFREHACLSCHSFDRYLVGPSFREVAARYAGDAGALARLTDKVLSGGAGAWGQIPMPPNRIPRADAEALVAYVLGAR